MKTIKNNLLVCAHQYSNPDLDKALSDTYEYIVNVIYTQERALLSEDMYSAYKSMNFKRELKRNVFVDFYQSIIKDLITKGKLVKPTINAEVLK